MYIEPSFSATAVTLLPPLPRQWAFLAECWNKTDILPPSPFCVWLSWLSRSLQNCPEYRYRLFRAYLQYNTTFQVRFIGQRRYYKYYEEQMLRYTLYTFLSKRRSAKYRLPTEIYSPLRRIWTLKADGLTTHRESSLSVHCLHSSVLFFIIFRHRGILLFNFPYHTLPIRETEDTMPVKFFGQAFSINPFQYFGYRPFYVFGKQAYPYW